MAITQTTLTTAITASGNTLVVGSGSGFPSVGTIANPAYPVRIGNEFMYAYAQPVSGTILVRGRGSRGTAAAAHDLLSKVEVSATPSDFPNIPAGADTELPPYVANQVTIGQDLTFTSADVAAITQNTVYPITKASAAAIVLVAPSKAQDGLVLTFTSLTAAAHVITATTLLGDAVSGSPHTTATFAAYIGASITLQVQNGIYNVISAVGVTIT